MKWSAWVDEKPRAFRKSWPQKSPADYGLISPSIVRHECVKGQIFIAKFSHETGSKCLGGGGGGRAGETPPLGDRFVTRKMETNRWPIFTCGLTRYQTARRGARPCKMAPHQGKCSPWWWSTCRYPLPSMEQGKRGCVDTTSTSLVLEAYTHDI